MESFVDYDLMRDVFHGLRPQDALYIQEGNRKSFQNPLFSETFSVKITQKKVTTPTNMRLKDFLGDLVTYLSLYYSSTNLLVYTSVNSHLQ